MNVLTEACNRLTTLIEAISESGDDKIESFYVADYHDILAMAEKEKGEDFSGYRVPLETGEEQMDRLSGAVKEVYFKKVFVLAKMRGAHPRVCG